ncbi:MAG: DAK2 domain-containing protein [Acidimicrobiia bacterium]
MAVDRLDAVGLQAVLFAYRDALAVYEEALDAANVYPVPDGDTGANMRRTLDAACAALGEGAGLAATSRAMRQGSFEGARGNSGVILSQVLRGLGEVFELSPSIDGPVLAAGLGAAATRAYEAMGRPVEGTMLTVAAAAAVAATGSGGDLVEVAESARAAAAAALAATPEQLPVLAEAGVVDAGGAGFLLLLDALLNVLDDRAVPSPLGTVAACRRPPGPAAGPRYEVMFLLDGPDGAIPDLKAAWARVGESVAVVGGDGSWNCHIHTDDIGAAIEAALGAGRPRGLRVCDLWS